MLKTTKVGKLELRIWWFIFLGLQIFIISLVIGSILAESWVKTKNIEPCSYIYSDYDEYDINGDSTYFCGKFEGTILKCDSGCEGSYQQQQHEWCGVVDMDMCSGCEVNTEEALCELFRKLIFAQWFFIACEIIVVFSIAVWIMGIFCYPKVPECFPMGFYSTFVAFLSQTLGVLGWLGITKAGLGDDCKGLSSEKYLITLCASDGPKLAISTSVIIFIVAVLYHVVVHIAKKKERQNSEIFGNSEYSSSINSQRRLTANDNNYQNENAHIQPLNRRPEVPKRKPQIPNPQSQPPNPNPKPKTQIPNPNPNPNPNPKPKPKNQNPNQNPNLNPKPKTQNLNPNPKPKDQNPASKELDVKNPLPPGGIPEVNPLNPPKRLESCNIPFIPKNPTEFDNDIDSKMKALPQIDDIISKITSAAKFGGLPKCEE